MPQHSTTRHFWLSGQRAAEQDRFFREALEAQGWVEGDETTWDAGWVTGMPAPSQFRRVSAYRKLNHFPGNAALTVKSRLHESLSSMKARVGEGVGEGHPLLSRLTFFPHAWVMPHDYHALQRVALAEPQRRWILKPTNASKGKGVRVLRDAAEAPASPNWLVQEYLDRPHTIRGHKYVLRLYVLISSLTPLRLYLYHQGFAKLASEPWDPDDADNPYSQLTNPDINALNTRVEVPVEFIDLGRYRAWLRDQGHDDEALFARIEDLVALTAISGVDALRRRTAEAGADPRGGYELLGLDCMIDDDLKPWILECNLSPSLGTCAAPEDGGIAEERIKGELVRDMLRLVDIAGESSPESEDASPAALLAEARAEASRVGGFKRLLPSASPERYLPFFSLPSLADMTLAEALAGYALPRPRLARRRVTELHEADSLALYAADTGRLYRPNDAAALIWLLATEGLDPDAIAETLQAASAEPPEPVALRRQVWQTLGEWCRDGLLCQTQAAVQSAFVRSEKSRAEVAADAEPAALKLRHDGRAWALRIADAAIEQRLVEAFGAGLEPLPPEEAGQLPWLSLLAAPAGYALAESSRLVSSRLTLAEVVPALSTLLLRLAARPGEPVLDVACWQSRTGEMTLLAVDDEACREALASSLGESLSRGARLTWQGDIVHVEPLGLPFTRRSKMVDDVSAEQVATPLRLITLESSEGEASAGLLPQARLDALAALLPRCHTGEGGVPSADLMARLDAWLEGVSRQTVRLPEDGSALFDTLVQSDLSSAGKASVEA
ncbi:amylase [Halomonas sp. KAO]|uniref:amylase n=1 Tax=Halomonas sp. KAO TaxID=2783858 RepID=UPI00189D766A|nr:amylase [Halomonas sp. KAO]MBF7053039.1 amylase [Halomonas sp. KAO]